MPFAGTVTPAPPDMPLTAPVTTPFAEPLAASVTAPRGALHPGAGRTGAEHRPVSATLAANEAMAARRSRGQAVLPLAFGEAGLPAPAAMRDALAAATASNGYGPVAGLAALRSARLRAR